MIGKLCTTALWTTALAVVICCAGCNRNVEESGEDRDDAPDAKPVARITVAGCVQRADRTATSVSRARDTEYILARARSGKDASTDASTYLLDTSGETLGLQIGHEVEVVAIMEDSAAVPTGTAGEAVPTGTAGDSGTVVPAPRLKVESIKTIQVPCPE